MSARYNAVRARLGPAGRDRLLREQRRWLAQRDRSCMAKGEQYSGGTLSAVVVAQCWVDVTKAPIPVLDTYLLKPNDFAREPGAAPNFEGIQAMFDVYTEEKMLPKKLDASTLKHPKIVAPME